VDVHVRLGSGPGLPDIQGELAIEFAGDHLVSGSDDRSCALLLEPPRGAVDERGRLLDVAVGVVDGLGHMVVADREVDQRPLRLRPPVVLSRDLDLAKRVALDPLTRRARANRDIAQPACRVGGGAHHDSSSVGYSARHIASSTACTGSPSGSATPSLAAWFATA